MEKQIINGLTVTRKSIFHSYDIFSERGCWLNTYRDLIDVEKFCQHQNNDFIRLGEYPV